MNLRRLIADEIAARGPMPFSRYMELCLYEPELGYYEREQEIFGKAGDFYTSSDVHAVFGRLLARQFEEMWRALGSPARVEVIELGPVNDTIHKVNECVRVTDLEKLADIYFKVLVKMQARISHLLP